MKKKISIIILAGVIVLALAGCSGGDAAQTPVSGEVVASEDVSEDVSEEPTEEVSEEITEEVEELLAQEVYEIYSKQSRGDFDINGGAILVKYKPWGESYKSDKFAIINDRRQFVPCAFEETDVYSEFSGGYAHMKHDGYYNVIDTEGNIVSTSPSDARYSILGGGDGYYLVERRVTGFDVSEFSYFILSVENDSLEFIGKSDKEWVNWEYCGSRVLKIGWNTFIGMETCHCYITYDDAKFVGLTENDELIWIYGREIYVTDVNDNTTLIATTEHKGIAKYGDGLIFVTDENGNTRYIDVEGNVVIDLSQYKVNDFETGGQFYDGYAALNMTGVDGLSYITIIDKSGEFMFEPLQCMSSRSIGYFLNGYLPFLNERGVFFIVDCSGNIVNPSISGSLHNIYCKDNMIFDTEKMTYYDMTGVEYPITIKAEYSEEENDSENTVSQYDSETYYEYCDTVRGIIQTQLLDPSNCYEFDGFLERYGDGNYYNVSVFYDSDDSSLIIENVRSELSFYLGVDTYEDLCALLGDEGYYMEFSVGAETNKPVSVRIPGTNIEIITG